MFRCKNCASIDNFGLMLSPDYQGEGKFSESRNEYDEIVIKVDNYEFIPDVGFMNHHAVCKYCGEIKIWEYYFSKFHKGN